MNQHSLRPAGPSLQPNTPANVNQQMGLAKTKILTGTNLHQLSDGALLKRVVNVDVSAEIDPIF